VPLRRNPTLMPQLVEPLLPLRDAADQASFKGEVDKAAQHKEMLSRITALESMIAELQKQRLASGTIARLLPRTTFSASTRPFLYCSISRWCPQPQMMPGPLDCT
jgi:hypothetical protein